MAVLVGLVSLMSAAAPAALASQVPFDVEVPLNEQGLDAGTSQSQDTGLIGFCDDEVRCTGFRVTEATTPADAGTTQGTVTLRGMFCLLEASAPCSSNGTPFTGIQITERVVDTPEGYANPAVVAVNFCLWVSSKQTKPYACNLPPIEVPPISISDLGNVADELPNLQYGFHWLD